MDNKLSQHELSQKLGLSLGRVNYVLSHLVDAGPIRAKRFKNSKNKIAYMYILTPVGIKSKMLHCFRVSHHQALLQEFRRHIS